MGPYGYEICVHKITFFTDWPVLAGGGANQADDHFIASEITKFFEE